MTRYANDKIYADYSYEDETASDDPKGTWVGGSEYYSRDYRCRVPRKMLERAEASGDHSELSDWLENNSDKPGVYI